MAYDFSHAKELLKETSDWFAHELLSIRTGRASPSILDGVRVESYGSQTPLQHVGSVSVSDPRSLLITPWDKSQIKAIEAALQAANLGLGISSDSSGIRVTFPVLTSETRTTLMKLAKQRMEDARIRVRQAREKVWDDIQAKESAGEIPEDEKFRAKEALQKLVDEANEALASMIERKEKEILE